MFAAIHVISNSNSGPVDVTPPTVPSFILITSTTTTSYSLTCDISTDSESSPIEYRFYKDDVAQGSWQLTNTYNYSGGSANERSIWKVKTRDSVGNESAFSTSYTFGTLCSAPTIIAGMLGNTSNTISINISNITNAVDYKVQYKQSSSGTWIDYADLPSGENIIFGLTSNTSYDFRAASKNINGSVGAYSLTYTTSTTSGSSLQAFSMNSSGQTTAINACSLGTSITTYYHDGPNFTPGNGDTIYTDSGGSNIFNGNNEYYLIETFINAQIASNGTVSNLGFCDA